MHAESRELRLEHDGSSPCPLSRGIQIRDALGHRNIDAAVLRKLQEAPLAVQFAQLLERRDEHSAARREQMPDATEIEDLFAGGQNQVDALGLDDLGQRACEQRQRIPRRRQMNRSTHRARPARDATGNAVGHTDGPALRGEPTRMIQSHRCAAA